MASNPRPTQEGAGQQPGRRPARRPAKKTAAQQAAAKRRPSTTNRRPQKTVPNPKNPKVAKPTTGMPRQDALDKTQLQALYKITARQLAVDDDLFDLFNRAWVNQWTKEQWDAELEKTDWWRTTQASVREYQLARAEGGADWDAKVKDSYEFVRRTAMEMGYNLDNDTLMDLAHQSMMMGWGVEGQEYELKRAISQMESNAPYGGDVQANMQNLKTLAQANGLRLDDSWFISQARTIASGMALGDDVENQIREWSAQLAPLYRDQIMSGINLIDVLSPYRQLMQREWGLPLESITLDDPTLMSAVSKTDETGKPVPVDLGEFQRQLRKDPRWMETDNAQNSVSSIAAGVLRMFGKGN